MLAAVPLRDRRGPPLGRAGCYSRRWARRGAVTRAALLGDDVQVLAVVAAEDRDRVAAQPAVEDFRVDPPEIDVPADVATVARQGRVADVGVEIGRGAVDAASDAAADGEHHAGLAVVRALGAV